LSDVLLSPARIVANKRELATALGVSLPTISAYLDRYPDLPVIERGTNGKEWQFDVEAVRAFMAEREAEEEAAEQERAARLQQLSLPITDPGDLSGQTDILTLDEIRAIKAADDLRKSRGFLVSVPELRQALTAAIGRMNAMQRSVITQVGRDFNLPDVVTRAIADRFADGQRAFVNTLKADAGLLPDGQNERHHA
jgi:phage terminase Nu1 subunit (DNA packaging protein)